MAEDSKIEWTDHTFNPWRGCTPVSPGCANCYAATLSKRVGGPEYKRGVPRWRTSPENWKKPLKWNRQAEGAERRPRVFCASLADWLDDEVPLDWLKDLLVLISETRNLDWLLLTKRPENFATRIAAVAENWRSSCEIAHWWNLGVHPRNVWVGTTTENQAMANKRVPILLRIPAAVRFLSCEPLIGQIDLHEAHDDRDTLRMVDWVICGGESGPRSRPMELEWARILYAQCHIAEIPFFMKQLGGVRDHRSKLEDLPEDLRIRQFPR